MIAANGDDGIHLHADDVDVFGNRIGVNANGDPLGNADEGIRLYYGASNNRIGDVTSGAGNVIAHNGANGVFLPYNGSAAATKTAIRGNSIFLNDALGIGLGGTDGTNEDGDGISRNDAVPSALSRRLRLRERRRHRRQPAAKHARHHKLSDRPERWHADGHLSRAQQPDARRVPAHR